MRHTCLVVAAGLLLLSIVVTSSARTLKGSDPAIKIDVPFFSMTGGNGEPLQLHAPGVDTTVGKKDTGCGTATVVDVKHPAGQTKVESGSKCDPTKVKVDAAGTKTVVVADGKPAASG